ncbi:MAG TPA: ABC transporter substrate-binding protein [Hansschlegelia sp.]
MRTGLLGALLAAALGASVTPAAADDAPLRVGYWTSGYSLGFGAVLEENKFLEKAGLKVEFRRFGEVGAPAQAVLQGNIDVAFAAPAAAAFNLGQQGAPVRVILATQVLEGQIVVKANGPITSIDGLKGKKIGMSRPGSSTHALATTLLKNNYGLQSGDYEVVPGNEGQLIGLLQRGDIDAAAVRNVTVAQVPAGELRTLVNVVDDWKKLTKGEAPPILGVALTTADVVAKRGPELAAFVKATQEAVAYGKAQPDAVANTLVSVANLNEKDAKAYAALWSQIYVASLTEADIKGMKDENKTFVDAGAANGVAPDDIYAPGPFQAAGKN